jgi:hypothetical protein
MLFSFSLQRLLFKKPVLGIREIFVRYLLPMNADPDPTPNPTPFFSDHGQINFSFKNLTFLQKFCVKIYFASIFSVRATQFMRKGKDPDPDPYI